MPLSYQFMYRHLISQYVTTSNTLLGGIVTVPLANSLTDRNISNYLSILDMPASRQLLENWSTTAYTLDNTWHNNFYNELRALNSNSGYPQQGGIRNIAISNGSECGTPQTYNAGDHLVNVQMDEKLSFLENTVFYVLSPLIGAVAGLTADPDFFKIGLLGRVPGSSRFIIDVQAKALSYTSGAHIYKGLIRYKKKILLVFNSQVSITNENKYQPSGILPYDYYGGGFFDTSEQSDIIDVGIGNITVEVEDKFSFIPTASALDIKQSSNNLNDSDYLKSYSGGLLTPTTLFDNFTTAFTAPNDLNNNNEEHLELNLRNGDWLAAEIDTGTAIQFTDCSYICNEAEILGTDEVCSSATYSVPSGGTFYNWSITEGSGIATLSGSGTTVTLNRIGTNSGNVTIRIEYGDGGVQCGNVVLTKRVLVVGTPTVNGIIPGQSRTLCQSYHASPESTLAIEAEGIPSSTGHSDWEWVSVSNNFIFNTSKNVIYLTPYQVGVLAFKVRVRNACGWSDYTKFQFNVVDCSSGGGRQRFSVFPNPTSGDVNIIEKSEESYNTSLLKHNKEKETITRLRLYDFSRSILIDKTRGSLNTLRLSQLTPGVYYLEIASYNTTETHKIIVK